MAAERSAAASKTAPGRTRAAAGPRFAALRSPSFRALWVGLIVSNAGSQMQSAAQAWLVRDLHREPFYLGLLSLSFGLPMLLLTPVGGAIADRFSPRLLKVTQSGMMLQSVILALLTLGGWIQFWQILLLSSLNAILLTVDNPARQALLPDLVERDQLPSAVSLNSVAWSGSALFGPALAGLLLAWLSPGGLFLLNALSYLAVLWVLFHLPALTGRVRPRHGSLLSEVAKGLRYVRADRPTSLLLVLLSANNVLGRSYTALMPIFARDVLEVGPQGYGLLLAVPGAGALVGGFGLAAARSLERQGRVAVVGWFGFAATLGLFTLSRSLGLSLVLLFLAAVCATLFNAAVATILQLRSPAEMRGRVMSLMATSNIGGSQLGGSVSGGLATYIGAPEAVGAGAVVLLLLGLALTARRGWRIDEAGAGPGGRAGRGASA
jgi:MFS family permease